MQSSTEKSAEALHEILLAGDPKCLEALSAAVMSRIFRESLHVARSGFQNGADVGTSGPSSLRLRFECKRYGEASSLRARELKGEIDDAMRDEPDLDAWILVTTKSVDLTLRGQLASKSEQTGLPILIIDWSSVAGHPPDLAALCGCSPDLVGIHYGSEAELHATALSSASAARCQEIIREVERECVGYDVVKALSDNRLLLITSSETEARAHFGQNVALAATLQVIEREAVTTQLQAWWTHSTRKPALVIGDEGVGKTWATLQWLRTQLADLPIVLAVPSAAIRSLANPTPQGMVEFLASELAALAGKRSRTFWMRRVEKLLAVEQGLLLLIDGLNQEPSYPWPRLFEVLQGTRFSSHTSVIATTQKHFFQSDLRQLPQLAVRPRQIEVPLYDLAPNGELDKMLELNGLTRAAMPPDVLELARNPRMFQLVLRFRNDISGQGEATVNRLLWAYGRNELGNRAGHAFSEGEWEEWLLTLASQWKTERYDVIGTGVEKRFSASQIADQVALNHSSQEALRLRLNDVLDNRWMEPVPGAVQRFRPRTELVHLALGLALVDHLGGFDDATVATELSRLLDPIRASSKTAEILAAALSIAASSLTPQQVITPIVSELLRSQNAEDRQRQEVVALAPLIAVPILDALEDSDDRLDASVRHWSVQALRNVAYDNHKAWPAVARRLQAWLAVVEGPDPKQPGEDGSRDHRSKQLLERIGTDQFGTVMVLGVPILIASPDRPYLGELVARILQGRRLAQSIDIFTTAAVAFSVGMRMPYSWEALKWLVSFNNQDAAEMRAAIDREVSQVLDCSPEPAVLEKIKFRIAALLLWLSGEPALESRARSLDPKQSPFFSYADYLANPSKSFWPLEHRHIGLQLADSDIRLNNHANKLRHYIADPTFDVPSASQQSVAEAVMAIDPSEVRTKRHYRAEDLHLDDMTILSARLAPEAHATLGRALLRNLRTRSGDSLLRLAAAAPEYLLIASKSEIQALSQARRSIDLGDEDGRSYASMCLLLAELPHLSPYEQICALAEDPNAFFSISLLECTQPCTSTEVEQMLHARAGQRRALEAALNHLAQHPIDLSDTLAQQVLACIDDTGDDGLHLVAKAALVSCAPALLGSTLLSRGWSYHQTSGTLEMTWCSEAILAAHEGKPLADLATIVAPWSLLSAAVGRGDPASLDAAFLALSSVLGSSFSTAEPPVRLTVETSAPAGRIGITQLPTDDHSFFEGRFDETRRKEAWEETQTQGRKHLRAVETAGALLYSVAMDTKHIAELVRHRPQAVETWLEGMEDQTPMFRARISAASGFYLALCESLLESDPELGNALWKCLQNGMSIKFLGIGKIDEMLLVLFRAPDSAPVTKLRDECFHVRSACNDLAYFELVIAALAGGAEPWLREKIALDDASETAWRVRRAAMLRGFLELPKLSELSWPEGEPTNSLEGVKHAAALRSNRQALALQRWTMFLRSSTVEEAYASWRLLLTCIDRRAWLWMSRIVQEEAPKSHSHWRLKMTYLRANQDELSKAMAQHEQPNFDQMERDLIGWQSPANLIDMSAL